LHFLVMDDIIIVVSNYTSHGFTLKSRLHKFCVLSLLFSIVDECLEIFVDIWELV
jgi:hypothetical protein